jgi:hypothetical protein
MNTVEIVTVATSIGGLFVAFAAFIIAVLTFQATIPRIRLTMWFGYEHSLVLNETVGAGIFVQIQNQGTRPVIITGIGGDYDGRFVKWFKVRVLKVATSGFLWTDAYRMLNDGQGGFRVFSDGQFKRDAFYIKAGTGKVDAKNAFLNLKCFWVCDADDKYYYLPKRALVKLQRELGKYLTDNEL